MELKSWIFEKSTLTLLVLFFFLFLASFFLIATDITGYQIAEIFQVADSADPVEFDWCNDNVQNQGEEGVDCGGSCDACPFDFNALFLWLGIILLIFLMVLGIVFLFQHRSKLLSENQMSAENKLKHLLGESNHLIESGKKRIAKDNYLKIKKLYSELPKEKQAEVKSKILDLHKELVNS